MDDNLQPVVDDQVIGDQDDTSSVPAEDQTDQFESPVEEIPAGEPYVSNKPESVPEFSSESEVSEKVVEEGTETFTETVEDTEEETESFMNDTAI